MNDASQANTNGTINDHDDDDHDLQDEDLDAFLLLIESRLRADFTSPDLSRTIASQGTSSTRGGAGSSGAATTALPSGNPSSPSKFLRLIGKVIDRASKPIKLRALMSVLGLESDRIIENNNSSQQNSNSMGGYSRMLQKKTSAIELDEQKTDLIVWKLLDRAEKDEEWVHVVAGILRGIMFRSGDINDILNVSSSESTITCRGKAAEKQLNKISNGILEGIRNSSVEGTKKSERAKSKLLQDEKSQANEDGEVTPQKQQEDEARLKSLLIKNDACPTFVPYQYSLLSPQTIKTTIPEIDTNSHFISKMDVDIFKVDAEVEEKRAAEEGKEMQLQKQRSATAMSSNNNNAGRGGGVTGVGGRTNGANSNTAIMAGRMRGRFSNLGGRGGRGGAVDTAASLLRPNRPGLVGRGGRADMAGRALTGRGSVGGRLGAAGRLGSIAGRGMAMGRAGAVRAAAPTTVSRTPLQRRTPGSTRAMLNSSGRGGTGGEASKMKVIDFSEVEGLKNAKQEREEEEQKKSVEERKAERKRKLLEEAAKSGLKNRDKRVNGGSAAVKKSQPSRDNEANNLEGGAQKPAPDPFPLPEGALDMDIPCELESYSTEHNHGHDPQHLPSTHHQYHQQQQLLEKSNKLSDEDRQKIYQFFQDRANSNPNQAASTGESNVWKVKLNEEKTVDPQTGEIVKETLYLELDYRTFGYKKTRKIKRK